MIDQIRACWTEHKTFASVEQQCQVIGSWYISCISHVQSCRYQELDQAYFGGQSVINQPQPKQQKCMCLCVCKYDNYKHNYNDIVSLPICIYVQIYIYICFIYIYSKVYKEYICNSSYHNMIIASPASEDISMERNGRSVLTEDTTKNGSKQTLKVLFHNQRFTSKTSPSSELGQVKVLFSY